MKKQKMFENSTCPECGEECRVKPLDDSFDYAGTHCTHGQSGTHYGDNHGMPVSDCCEAYIEDAEEIYRDYDIPAWWR